MKAKKVGLVYGVAGGVAAGLATDAINNLAAMRFTAGIVEAVIFGIILAALLIKGK